MPWNQLVAEHLIRSGWGSVALSAAALLLIVALILVGSLHMLDRLDARSERQL